jgi:N-acetyl-anhydromuramyl-L-alanine amidase AmpD
MPIDRIVIHCTVSPCVRGGRYSIADMFSHRVFKSAHYIADPAGIIQDVGDSKVAEHAPPNEHSIGIEMCDPLISPSWDMDHRDRWNDPDHSEMLSHVARLTARLALAYNVPVRRIRDAHERGICGHVDVSKTFGETDHWDPGPGFPWDRFMKMVQENAHRIEKAGR